MTSSELEPRFLQVIARFRASEAGAKDELAEILRACSDERALALLEKLKRAERLVVQWEIDAAIEEILTPAAAPGASSTPAAKAEPVSPGKSRRGAAGSAASGRNKVAASRSLRVGSPPRFLRWLDDGDLAYVDTSHVVHRIDVATMTVTARLDRHGRGGAVDFDLDRSGKRLVTFTAECDLRVWDAAGALEREVHVEEEGGFGCALVDEGRQVVVAALAQQNRRGVRLFDVRTGEQRGSLDVAAPRIVVPLSATGDAEDVLVVDVDEGVLLHAWSSGRTRAYGFPGLNGALAEDDDATGFSVQEVAPSMDWGVALLGGDGIATVWNRDLGRTRMTLEGVYQRVALAPLSDRLFAARGEHVELWDLNERSRVGRLATGAPSLLKVTDTLVFAGVANELSVWRSSDRRCLQKLRLDSPAHSLACRGRDVVVASTSGEIRAFSMDGIDLPPTDFARALALGERG